MDDVKNKRIIRIPCSGLKKYELNCLEREASQLFAPFRREGDTLLFDVSNLVSICDYVGKNPPVSEYCKIMDELRKAVVLAEEYLLNKENLCLDPDTVFWNEATGKICFLYALPDHEEQEEMDYFRMWIISLWHRSVSMDWLNEEMILAIHLSAVCFFRHDELVNAISKFLERWRMRQENFKPKNDEQHEEPSLAQKTGFLFKKPKKAKR